MRRWLTRPIRARKVRWQLGQGMTGDEGDVILRIAGSGFPGLPPLLCCSGPVGLAYLGAFVHGGTPLGPVHGGLFPGVGGEGKRFQGCF